MTREDVIRMAREAGITLPAGSFPERGSFTLPELLDLVRTAVAAEREAVRNELREYADNLEKEGEDPRAVRAFACIVALGKWSSDANSSKAEAPAQTCCKGGPQWGHAWDCKELP